MTWEVTVSISWVQTVLAQARRQGVTDAALMAAAGLPAAALALDRWPIDDVTRIWRAATRLTQDAGFGLKAGSFVGPASLNVVGFIVQSAATLRQAIAAIQKYQRLVSDGVRLQLLAVGDASWLIYHPRQGDLAFSAQQVEAVLAAVASSAQWITQQPSPPRRVRFSHPPQGPLQGYRQVFGCPVEFDQAFSGLLLDNAALDRPAPQANPDLARVHESFAAAQLERLAPGRRLDQAVQAWITRRLGRLPLPTRDEAARSQGLSPRTLARRLQALHTSYADLLDCARRDLALEQAATTGKPFKDIAAELGFAELSPFYRAFARWSGVTPGAWRRRSSPPARRAQPRLTAPRTPAPSPAAPRSSPAVPRTTGPPPSPAPSARPHPSRRR